MNYRASSTDSSAERRRRYLFVGFWSAVLLVVLLAFRAILVPFVLGALIAYILSPLVRRLTAVPVAGRHLPRWGAVVLLYAVILSGLGVTVRFATPAIAAEVSDFVRDEVPKLSTEVRTRWLPRLRALNERFGRAGHGPEGPQGAWGTTDQTVHLEPRPEGGGWRVLLPADGIMVRRDGEDRFRVVPVAPGEAHRGEIAVMLDKLRALGAGHTEDLVRVGRGIVGSVIGAIFLFFMTLMLSAYMLVTQAQILAFFTSLVPPASRPSFEALLTRIDRGLAGVVRGQLIICGVNGVLSAVGFAAAGLPYWPLLALLAALFSIVPIFGSILSAVPAVAIGLTQGLGMGVFVLLWILGIHQLEANLLNPKIMGDQAKIHPVLVVFSLLAGEHFFGILGALLAVPVMSIVQSVFLHWRRHALNYGDPQLARDSLVPAEPAVARVAVGHDARGSDAPAGEGSESGVR